MTTKFDALQAYAEIERLNHELIKAGANVAVAYPERAIIDAMLASGLVKIVYEGEHIFNEAWVTLCPAVLANPKLLAIEEIADEIAGPVPTAADLIAAETWKDGTKPADAFRYFRFGGYEDVYGAGVLKPGWNWHDYNDVKMIENVDIDEVLEFYG